MNVKNWRPQSARRAHHFGHHRLFLGSWKSSRSRPRHRCWRCCARSTRWRLSRVYRDPKRTLAPDEHSFIRNSCWRSTMCPSCWLNSTPPPPPRGVCPDRGELILEPSGGDVGCSRRVSESRSLLCCTRIGLGQLNWCPSIMRPNCWLN